MEHGFTFLGFTERIGEVKEVNEEQWGGRVYGRSKESFCITLDLSKNGRSKECKSRKKKRKERERDRGKKKIDKPQSLTLGAPFRVEAVWDSVEERFCRRPSLCKR